jgi:hypothetical protein
LHDKNYADKKHGSRDATPTIGQKRLGKHELTLFVECDNITELRRDDTTSGYPSAEVIGYIFYYQKMKPMASNTMGAPRVKKWLSTSSGMLFLDQIMTSLKLP